MTLKNKKYPQNLHTQKNINFLKTPKNIKILNFKPQKKTGAYRCMKTSEYPPGSEWCHTDPEKKYKKRNHMTVIHKMFTIQTTSFSFFQSSEI